MSAEYSSIVEKIAALLQTIENVGRVHSFRIFAQTRADFDAMFFDQENERHAGWTISRESFSNIQLTTEQENERKHPFVLRGIMAVNVDTETEIIFQQVCNDIADKFTPQENLDELVELIEPVQARIITYVTTAGVGLCHYAELTMIVQELVR